MVVPVEKSKTDRPKMDSLGVTTMVSTEVRQVGCRREKYSVEEVLYIRFVRERIKVKKLEGNGKMDEKK